MNEVILLLDYIPELISYFAIGFIYLSFYRFARLKKNEINLLLYLFECFSISLIIKTLYVCACKLIKVSYVNGAISYLICFIIAIVFAYIIAKIVNKEKFNSFLLHLGVHKTINDSIWKDIYKANTWMYIQLKDNPYGYWGECQFIEEDASDPKIVLIHYRIIKTETGEQIADHSHDNNTILINTKDVVCIELKYGLKEKQTN